MIWWMSMMTMDATIQPFLGSTPYTLSAGAIQLQCTPSQTCSYTFTAEVVQMCFVG